MYTDAYTPGSYPITVSYNELTHTLSTTGQPSAYTNCTLTEFEWVDK